MACGPATVAATIHFTTTRFPDGALDGGPDQPDAAMHGGNCQKKQAPGDSRHAGIVAAVGRVRMMSTTILMIHRLTSAG
jgi:hypothetical protein